MTANKQNDYTPWLQSILPLVGRGEINIIAATIESRDAIIEEKDKEIAYLRNQIDATLNDYYVAKGDVF